MAEERLNQKQRLFVSEYLIDKHGTNAAIRAGYSADSAEVQASRLLRNDKIRAAIDAQFALQEKRTLITADRILAELMRVGLADIGEAFNDDGSLKRVRDMPEELRRAISSVEVDELWEGYGEDRQQIGVTKKIKFWEKTKALQLLGNHLKLFVDRLEVSGKVELASVLKEARERANAKRSGNP